MKQMTLFKTCATDEHFESNVGQHNFNLVEVDIGDITFAPGQQESVHRWYRLTPSYSPGLVRFFLNEMGCTHQSFLLDPFCGRGTTIIECQKQGIPALGFEVNPLLHRVGEYSLKWTAANLKLLDEFIRSLQATITQYEKHAIDHTVRELQTSLPIIHDVFRWWKPDILKDLIVARQLMLREEFAEVRHLLWLAVNSASLDCANIHRNHPTITFDDDHDRLIDAFTTIRQKVSDIHDDLATLTTAELDRASLGSIEQRNSCQTVPVSHTAAGNVTHIITSPPYPNRFSYIHQTRPQLHFMELVQDRGHATEIDLETIGGTWGRATSNLMKSLIIPPAPIRDCLNYFELLKDRSVLMCNYATKYFMDLDAHVKTLRTLKRGRLHAAYVVGNSRLSGVEIYTEVILAKIFELNDFKVERILLFRKRGGRKRLYETAVCVTS